MCVRKGFLTPLPYLQIALVVAPGEIQPDMGQRVSVAGIENPNGNGLIVHLREGLAGSAQTGCQLQSCGERNSEKTNHWLRPGAIIVPPGARLKP